MQKRTCYIDDIWITLNIDFITVSFGNGVCVFQGQSGQRGPEGPPGKPGEDVSQHWPLGLS